MSGLIRSGRGAKVPEYTGFEVEVNPYSFYVEQFQAVVEQELDRLACFNADCPPRLAEATRYSLLAGGKRLRPLLVLLAAEACGGEFRAGLPAAAAIEMVHTYSLIHDDLPAMDDDDLRRGRPTCHRQYDEATAILAGDGLLTLAFETLAAEINDANRAVRCCLELSRAAGVEGMVGGQQADLEAETRFQQSATPEDASPSDGGNTDGQSELDQLKAIHRRKTGKLITCSVRMGAILGDATDAQLDAVTRYGDAIGLAFQVMDDILDCTSTVEAMGKGVGKDADRDKLTYPGLLGLQASRDHADSLVREAQEALSPLGPPADGLRAVADYIITRDR